MQSKISRPSGETFPSYRYGGGAPRANGSHYGAAQYGDWGPGGGSHLTN
jgi:hypothetical protein